MMNASNFDLSKQSTADLRASYERLNLALYQPWTNAQEKSKAHTEFYFLSMELTKRRAI